MYEASYTNGTTSIYLKARPDAHSPFTFHDASGRLVGRLATPRSAQAWLDARGYQKVEA